MEIKFTTCSSDRKNLAISIGDFLGCSPTYLGAPSFAYEIGNLILDRNNCLVCNDAIEQEIIQVLLEKLKELGFSYESPNRLVIEMPKDGFTDTSLANLVKLIESKSSLIKKALKADRLAIEQTEDTLLFPWFTYDSSPEEVKAYTRFVFSLCVMAKTLNRVNALQKDVDNEKYAFRCFLLRLGFIGAEFKAERKILLRNLSGNTAFKGGNAEADE